MAIFELFRFDHLSHFHVWSSIAVTILILFIYFPTLSYNLYQYYQKRGHFVYKRRYAKITIIEVSLQLINFICTCIAYTLIWSNTAILSILFYSLGHISCWICYWHLVWRFYMLHYDITFTMISLNNSWKQFIHKKENEANWYILHKSTLGNKKYVQWRIIYPAIVLSLLLSYFVLFLIVQFSNWNPSTFHTKLSVDSMFYLLPAIILGTIYFKTEPFDDMLFIKPELKYIWISFILYVFMYCSVWTYIAISNPHQHLYHLILFLQLQIGATIQFIGAMVATYYVRKKLSPLIQNNQYIIKRNKIRNKHKLKFVESISLLSDHSDDDSKEADDVRHVNKNQNINLTEIFTQPKALEIFSIHLANELSLENLICLIECLQFQAFVHKFMIRNDDNDTGSISSTNSETLLLYQEIVFADIVPLSSIVFGDNDNNINQSILTEVEFLLQVKEKCYTLYEKYIINGSEMEINVSSDIKKSLDKCMRNYNEFVFSANYNLNILLHVYDKTIMALYTLMNDSLQRFMLSYEFEKLKKLYLVNY